MPHRWLPPLLLLVLLFSGCSSVRSFKGMPLDAGGIYIGGLPPLTQNKSYACGAVCVASVAANLGVSPETFREKHPSLPQDLTAQDLVDLATGLGLQAFAYGGSADDLEQNLRNGRPLIVMIPQPIVPAGDLISKVLLATWNEVGPKPRHWVVVRGFTNDNAVIIHDPDSGPMTIEAKTFQSLWSRYGRITVLIAAR